MERLQAELEKKTVMLMEVKKHLREAVDRERHIKSLSTDPTVSRVLTTVYCLLMVTVKVMLVEVVYTKCHVQCPYALISFLD